MGMVDLSENLQQLWIFVTTGGEFLEWPVHTIWQNHQGLWCV